jgi:hypothetical protein
MIPQKNLKKPHRTRFTRISALLLFLFGCFVLNVHYQYSIYFFKFSLRPSAIRHEISNCVDIPVHDLTVPGQKCWTRQEVDAVVQSLTMTFISVLQKNRIEFWIDQSTLLGSIIYDHILVPHITSAQLAFTRASLDSLQAKSASLDIPSNQYILTFEGKATGRFVDIHSGFFVELIAYDLINKYLKPTVEPQICHTCSETNYTIPEEWIFPLSECTLLNQSVPCPKRSVNILQQLYKDLPCVLLSEHHTIHEFRNDLMCWRRHQVQSMLRNLTISLASILEEHNIEYWLDSGTLLGQVRDQGLILHDNDADFGITEASLKMLSNLPIADAASLFPYALDVMNSAIHNYHMRDANLPARWMDTRSGLYVDIFEFKALNDGKELAPLASSCWGSCVNCTRLANDSGSAHFVVPRDWIYPLRRCQFENVTVSCPNKPNMYLEKLYGRNFMQPLSSDPVYPPEDLFPYNSILLLSSLACLCIAFGLLFRNQCHQSIYLFSRKRYELSK